MEGKSRDERTVETSRSVPPALMNASQESSVLIGLIGDGIQASLSPAMHQREGLRHGLHYVYQLLDVEILALHGEPLPQLLDAAQVTGFRGLNITHPHKQAVIPLLDELSDNAAAIGAVNTVVFEDGRRVGHNTDCKGFTRSIEDSLGAPDGQNVVLLGAGGAGSAVAHALAQLGVRGLSIYDCVIDRAKVLADAVCTRYGKPCASAVDDLATAMDGADGLVHATPSGMAGHPSMPLPAKLIKPTQWVADIVYFPLDTELLRVARGLGCRTVDGGGMAVYQAASAFELFTGTAADAAAMRSDFDEIVRRRNAIGGFTAGLKRVTSKPQNKDAARDAGTPQIRT